MAQRGRAGGLRVVGSRGNNEIDVGADRHGSGIVELGGGREIVIVLNREVAGRVVDH